MNPWESSFTCKIIAFMSINFDRKGYMSIYEIDEQIYFYTVSVTTCEIYPMEELLEKHAKSSTTANIV